MPDLHSCSRPWCIYRCTRRRVWQPCAPGLAALASERSRLRCAGVRSFIAAAMGRLEEVQTLLKKGADPNHGACRLAGGRSGRTRRERARAPNLWRAALESQRSTAGQPPAQTPGKAQATASGTRGRRNWVLSPFSSRAAGSQTRRPSLCRGRPPRSGGGRLNRGEGGGPTWGLCGGPEVGGFSCRDQLPQRSRSTEQFPSWSPHGSTRRSSFGSTRPLGPPAPQRERPR